MRCRLRTRAIGRRDLGRPGGPDLARRLSRAIRWRLGRAIRGLGSIDPGGVYAVTAPVDPARKLVSVTFADTDPSIRMFDLQPATTGKSQYACTSDGGQ